MVIEHIYLAHGNVFCWFQGPLISSYFCNKKNEISHTWAWTKNLKMLPDIKCWNFTKYFNKISYQKALLSCNIKSWTEIWIYSYLCSVTHKLSRKFVVLSGESNCRETTTTNCCRSCQPHNLELQSFSELSCLVMQRLSFPFHH